MYFLRLDFSSPFMPIVAGVWDRGVSVVRAPTLQILAHLPDAGVGAMRLKGNQTGYYTQEGI